MFVNHFCLAYQYCSWTSNLKSDGRDAFHGDLSSWSRFRILSNHVPVADYDWETSHDIGPQKKSEGLSLPRPEYLCMGFGSYDESEQEDRDTGDIDDNDGVAVHEHTHDGEVSFESDASQEELLDKLDEMKD